MFPEKKFDAKFTLEKLNKSQSVNGVFAFVATEEYFPLSTDIHN